MSEANLPAPSGVIVGTMAWQGTENSVKAYLLSQGVAFPPTHDFSILLGLVSKTPLGSAKEFNELQTAVEVVTCSGSYTDRKYPGTDPGFWMLQPRQELVIRADASKRAFEICCSSIP